MKSFLNKPSLRINFFFITMFILILVPIFLVWVYHQIPQSQNSYYINLTGTWKIHEGFQNYWLNKELTESSDWKNISLPGLYYEQGFKDSNCVIRKTILLPNEMQNHNLFMVVGSLPAGVGKVFINGKLTGELGYYDLVRKKSGIGSSDGVFIPQNLIENGSNTIAIQIHQEILGFDGIQQPILFLGIDSFVHPYYENIQFIHNFFQYGFIYFSLLMLTIVIYILYSERKSENNFKNISVTLLLVSAFIYNIIYSGAFINLWFDFTTINKLLLISIIFIFLTLSEFTNYYYLKKTKKYFVFQRYSLILLMFSMVFINNDLIRLFIYKVFAIYSIFVLVYLSAFSFYESIFNKKKQFGIVISCAVMLSALTAIIDLMSNLGILSLPLVFNITISSVAIIVTVVVLADFIAMSNINKELTVSLQLSNEDLKEMDRLKDDFLANTSHELKTPLNGIIGLADSLAEGVAGCQSEKAKENLNMIIQSAKRLLHLINDILDYSKLRDNSIQLNIKPVDVYTTVTVVIHQLKTLADSKNLSLINNIPLQSHYVYADENRLQQILYNLIGNAIKFSPSGNIIVSADISNQFLQISIIDSGIGIEENKLKIIFNEFIQTNSSISRIYEGTGLGLSITKKLVELQNGTIWAESEFGKGSVFHFTLPISKEKENFETSSNDVLKRNLQDSQFNTGYNSDISRSIQNAFVPYHSQKNITILIVEDDPVNRQILNNYLMMADYSILNANDGIQALEMLETHQVPDIILLDVMMPRMSGYELAREIRLKHPLYELPIIMLTAKDRVVDVVTGLEAGANDYLVKPFDKKELFARVSNQIILKNAVKEHDRLNAVDQDLSIAMTVQKSVLTKKNVYENLHEAEVDVFYQPMNFKVSGDYYHICKQNDKSLWFFLSDASGHGLQAALSTMQMDVLVKQAKDIFSPEKKIEFINQILTSYLVSENFFTAFSMILRDNKIFYSSAGHITQYIARKTKNKIQIIPLKATGKPLGLIEEIHYQLKSAPVKKGDLIFIFSDGLIEEFNKNGKEFSEEGLINIIKTLVQTNSQSVAEINQNIIHELLLYLDGQEFNDDITLITLKVR